MRTTSYPLVAAMLLMAWVAAAQSTPKVVFVCEHGSAKSVIAAAHLRRLAAEKGIDVEVISRGTTPDAEVPANVRAGLKKDGIEVGALKPALVSRADLAGAAVVVSFGSDLSALADGKTKVQDWSATPAVTSNYDGARSYIVKRLEELLEKLRSQ